MRKQDFLLHLIDSLSPNERRYFKLYSSIQPGEKEYLRLFEALEGKKDYNTADLCKELNFTANQLAEKKHYLGQVLIKSLQNYEEQTSDIAAVYRMKEEAVTLLGRRLFEYTLDHINKALSKAWELEVFEVIAEMQLTKYSCLYGLRRFNEFKQITLDSKKAAVILAELFEIYELRAHATECQAKADMAGFNALIKHPLMKAGVEKLKSMKARIAWFQIKSYYYSMESPGSLGFLKTARQEVAYYDKHSAMKIISPVTYFVSYARLAEAESLAGNHQVALDRIDALRSILQPSPQISKARVSSLMAYANGFFADELRFLKRYDEALEMLLQLEKGIEKRPLPEIYMYYYTYALTLLHLKKSEEVVEKVEELLKMKEGIDVKKEMFLRPVQILAQLDLGNYMLVPYMVKAARAWMKRQKIVSVDIEKFFSLTYALAMANEPQRKERWQKLQEAVNEGSLNVIDAELNLKDWLERKMAR